jgi:hypothetical protein
LGQQQSDEKNIRRRVYDALNVLMAMGIILKDKQDIQWKGLPSATLDDIQELKVNFFQCFFTCFSLYDPFFSRAYLHVKGASFFSCFIDFVSDSDESYGGTHLLCYLPSRCFVVEFLLRKSQRYVSTGISRCSASK